MGGLPFSFTKTEQGNRQKHRCNPNIIQPDSKPGVGCTLHDRLGMIYQTAVDTLMNGSELLQLNLLLTAGVCWGLCLAQWDVHCLGLATGGFPADIHFKAPHTSGHFHKSVRKHFKVQQVL